MTSCCYRHTDRFRENQRTGRANAQLPGISDSRASVADIRSSEHRRSNDQQSHDRCPCPERSAKHTYVGFQLCPCPASSSTLLRQFCYWIEQGRTVRQEAQTCPGLSNPIPA